MKINSCIIFPHFTINVLNLMTHFTYNNKKLKFNFISKNKLTIGLLLHKLFKLYLRLNYGNSPTYDIYFETKRVSNNNGNGFFFFWENEL